MELASHKTEPVLALTHEEWLSSHLFLDKVSLALHRAVAKRLRKNPALVLGLARANLQRWLTRGESKAWREWWEIIENSSPETICDIITQDSDEGQRLRSSTPFAGVLSPIEREQIWQACAQREPFTSNRRS